MKLTIPETNYINSEAVARRIVDNAVNTYSDSWELIERSQRHIEGESPVPYPELKKRGLSWASNDNMMKARAQIEKGTMQNVNKVSEALMLGYATFRDYDESKDKDEVTEFLKDEGIRGVCAAAIGYAFSNMLMKEHRLASFLQDVEYPSYAFGFCPLIFEDKDWIPAVVHPRDIAFRPKSKINEIKTFVVFQNVDAIDLYKRWVEAQNDATELEESNGKKRVMASSGWNLKALEEVLFHAFSGKINKEGMDHVPEDWAQIHTAYIENSSYVIENTEDVMIAKIYHVELDGSMTLTYIPYPGDRNPNGNWRTKKTPTTSTNAASSVDCILYSKNFKNYKQASKLILIRDSGFTENSYIENYRGIAKYAVKDSIRYNRVFNNMQNKLMFSGAPFFEKSNTAIGESFKLGVGAGYIIAPTNYPLAPRQPSFDINSDMVALRFAEGEYNRDTEQFNADLKGRLSSRPSKQEVQSQAAEVQDLNNAKNIIKFRDYSLLFHEVLKKLQKITPKQSSIEFEGWDRFYKECLKSLKAYAKTKEDINKILEAIDSFSLQPIVSDETTLTIAIQMSETPFARNRFKRMLLLKKGMPIEEINFAVPLIVDKYSHFDDERFAIIENDMFWNTNEAIVQGKDDQIIHCETHLAKGERVMQGAQQGQLAPDVAFKYLSNLIAHVMQHFDLLGRDAVLAKRLEDYVPRFKKLQEARTQMQLAAQKIMDAQAKAAQQVQIDPETQSKIASKNVETAAKIERSNKLQETRTQQSNEKIQLDHQRKVEEMRLRHERETAELTQGA
jgi:hypothetical protein